jgi:beta-lactamase regulating signal transducer with metallopeptidase domain
MNAVDVAARYLLTYVAHSTLLTLLVWAGVRLFARRNPRLEEIALRGALLGALVTAAVPIGFALVPRAARAVPDGPATLAYAARLAASVGPAEEAPLRPAEIQIAGPVSLPATAVSPRQALLLAWAAGVFGVALSFAWSYRRLRARLRGRTDVTDADPVGALRRLTADSTVATPVRLTESARLPVPVALGTRRPEICVPTRALAELGHEQQETLLAHEVAHLERRDPAWLALYNVVCGVFFFQPLHWIVRRRLIALSEILSDQWAVERTGRPVDLARCLSEVADWIVRDRGLLAAPGMAGYRSQLGQRIERLLTHVPSRVPLTRGQRWLAAAAPLVLVAALAPAISLAEKPAQEEETKTVEVEAKDVEVLDDVEPAPAPAKAPKGRRAMPPPAPPAAPVVGAVPPSPPNPPQAPQVDRLMILRNPGEIRIRGSAAELAAIAKQLELLSEKAGGLREKVEQELDKAGDDNLEELDIELHVPEIHELARDAALLGDDTRRIIERTVIANLPNPEEIRKQVEQHRQEMEKHHKEVLKHHMAGPNRGEIQEHVRQQLQEAQKEIQRAAAELHKNHAEAAKAMAEQQKQLAEQMKQLKQQAEELRAEAERMKRQKDESR